jgi:GT2 family glycosyltransferase
MTVAAVIPHWNRRDLLATLLANLREQTRAFDEVIVVDNGSTDDSVQVAERAGAREVRLGKNLGFATAVNRGVKASRSDWVAVLNNDVTLDADWLEKLLAAAESEQIWFATGKILMAGDRSRIDGTFDEISRGACPYRCGSGISHTHTHTHESLTRASTRRVYPLRAPHTLGVIHTHTIKEMSRAA